ncbi:carbamoyl-phosphate synthase (glutamine-hydrolyzing) large subunit [Candidatus Peregrinibacteria bacterium]|nr:carbamoyl-phosphate synthase (glutamine-hydrolyzing) large subunit [Candidatus Peregrinibacteria bacterium]
MPKKVLILGSGALKIGEAGEFDYSGSQAIKALKEEGIEVVLINPNIATNQTSKGLADKIYFLPVTPFFVEKVIEKEKPDGLLLSFGGQTALNCGVALKSSGVLRKNDVEVLGTPVASIEKTEDRALFNKELNKIKVNVPRSFACTTVGAAVKAAKKIGYPVLVRAAYALGGKGSGFAADEKELNELLALSFAFSSQVLVEENLKGWKEVEYEIVRDAKDNCITVCNMENFDPLGIHTGESIVVAPSQTLSNEEYHKLREIGIKVIRHLGIVGECNIQYALDPESEEYRVIEVNARLSRSSALASKATGYPLAYVAAKLALGYSLPELRNAITGVTTACFEPALDYVALKIPRWDLDKFRKVSHNITSEMKSVGEIMALGRSFEEVMQKGLRMLQIGMLGLTENERLNLDTDNLKKQIAEPTPKRALAVADALAKNWTIEEIHKLSGIDPWFLGKLNNIVEMSEKLRKEDLDEDLMLSAKKYGFSDKQIALATKQEENQIRQKRKRMGIEPYVKQIDTMAAEYPAKTNYLYLTYHATEHDIDFVSKKKRAMVLGSGAYCIGSSVEFDWCSVNAIKTLDKYGYETIMVNYNPETVSTDYDTCDKLYFDELSLERVLDIYELESPDGMIISVGGQIPNNLVMKLDAANVNIFGTEAKNIDRAENRHKFSQMLDDIGVDQPRWKDFATTDLAFKFADEVGYPVLVRPSYVLSGAAMAVAQNEESLQAYLAKAAKISKDAPVVITKFEMGAKEIEIDAVAQDGELVIYAIAEHVEQAGVHSGDATIVLPPQKLYLETVKRIRMATKKIAKALNISGPFNIQFLAVNNEIKVIECNLRSSRSFPFSSKVTGYNFIEIATEAMLGKAKKQAYRTVDLDHVGVKAPQFSFSRLKGADPVLSVEMASTGEVACFGDDLHEAFLKAMISTGFKIPKEKRVLISIGKIEDKADFLQAARKLELMGYKLHATSGTADLFRENGIKVSTVHKADSGEKPDFAEVIANGKVDWVINIPRNYSHEEMTTGYAIRRLTIDNNIPLTTNVQVAKLMVDTLEHYGEEDLKIEPWCNY